MRAVLASLLLTLTAGAFAQSTAHVVIPQSAAAYRTILIKEARNADGVGANVALYAAQIHAESRFRINAVSPVGAKGMSQFMPGTAADMNRIHSNSLGQLEIYSPLWSIRAMVLYNGQIRRGIAPFGSEPLGECTMMAMVMSGYNGGPGWIPRDRRLARDNGRNPDLWFDNTALYSTRSRAAFKENREYPERILKVFLPAYLRAGWPGEDVCK